MFLFVSTCTKDELNFILLYCTIIWFYQIYYDYFKINKKLITIFINLPLYFEVKLLFPFLNFCSYLINSYHLWIKKLIKIYKNKNKTNFHFFCRIIKNQFLITCFYIFITNFVHFSKFCYFFKKVLWKFI